MGETFTAADVRSLILDEIADWGSQKMVAKRIGISASYLSDILLQRREPGPVVASYFDLEAVTVYRAKEPASITPELQRGVCDLCMGTGEIFGHADDCDNDSCALNGDYDSCIGKVEPCPVCGEFQPTGDHER